MWFELMCAGIAVLYVSSQAAERVFDGCVFLPGFICIGLFIGFLNGGENILLWAIGVPVVAFALKPKG